MARAAARSRAVAHNAAFDVRVLRQAFARAALEWPRRGDLQVSLARRSRPAPPRGVATLPALGVQVDEVHRALLDARTCARCPRALRAWPPTRRRSATRSSVLRPRKVRTRPPKVKRPRGERPHLAEAAARAGRLHLPRRRRAAAVRRQVRRPAHARPLALHRRRDLGGRGRARRPPGHGVRARRAAARGPPDQGAAPAGQRARQDRARRLRLPALPAGHPVPDPRGRARAGRRARGLRRPGARAGGRGGTGRAAQLAVRPAPLRAHAAAPRASVGLRADGPLPVALPARPRSEPLPRAAGRGAGAVRRPRRGQGAARARGPADQGGLGRAPLRTRGLAAAPTRPARGAAGPAGRRAARDAHGRAARARAAPGGRGPLRRDLDRAAAAWWIGARSTPAADSAPARRARSAPRPRPASCGGWLPADAVAEARLVGAWIAANRPPALELGARTGEAAHAAFLARAGVLRAASSTA